MFTSSCGMMRKGITILVISMISLLSCHFGFGGFIYRTDKLSESLFILKHRNYKASKVIETTAVTSLAECARKCSKSKLCWAISYNRNIKSGAFNCILSQNIEVNGKKAVPATGWNHYESLYNGQCSRLRKCDRYKHFCKKNGVGQYICTALQIVSKKKPTVQPSTRLGGKSSRAVDGKRNSNFNGDSCSLTTERANPWWRVDLKAKHYITSVTITNRSDCCYTRFTQAEIRVGMLLSGHGPKNPLCTKPGLKLGRGQTKTFKCDLRLSFGRYVNIVLRKRTSLTLCEVEVMGIKV